MSQDIDKCATTAGFWPHAVISGHAHNYQRFTRLNGATQIPYIIGGCGGHNVDKLQSGSNGAIRTPVSVSSTLTFENYDDADYGYLRIIVTAEKLRIEYHPASDGAGGEDTGRRGDGGFGGAHGVVARRLKQERQPLRLPLPLGLAILVRADRFLGGA